MINSATPATMTTTLARLGITVGSFSATENLNGPDIAFMRFLQGPSRYRSNRWTSAAGENRDQAGSTITAITHVQYTDPPSDDGWHRDYRLPRRPKMHLPMFR